MIKRLVALSVGFAVAFVYPQTDSDNEPVATLDISTDEVTWLSIDLSPDGEQFVLEVLGDLYLLDRSGGKAEPLLADLAFDSQPVFSPDGKHIAFISDVDGVENLWIITTDGKRSRRLTDSGDRMELASPRWSPSGDHVIVSRTFWGQRTFEIWAYHLDGGKGVQLTEAKPRGNEEAFKRHNALGGVYSPDGKYLYYARKYGGYGYDLKLPLWQVVRKDLKKQSEVVVTDARGSAFRPMLSPNGDYLVYGTRFNTQTGLRIRNLETGTDEWLAYPIQRDDQESRFTRDILPGYAFSPNGQIVYYTKMGKLFGVDISSKSESEVPFQIDMKLEVNPRQEFPYRIGLGPIKARLLRDAKLSPDGKYLIFSAFARIYKHELRSAETKVITPEGMFASQPCWSPNGREIAFVTWDSNRGDIWKVNANGRGKPKRITRVSAFYTDPVWTLDGRNIIALRGPAYVRAETGGDWGQTVDMDLVKIPTKTGATELVRHARNYVNPHFGPEKDRIYIYRTPGLFSAGDSGLYSMRMDGTDLRRKLVLKGEGIYFAEDKVPVQSIKISPDGTHVLAKHVNQLYVLRFLDHDFRNISTSIKNHSIPLEALTEVGADEFGWSSDSKSIYWTAGHDVYVQPLSSVEFSAASSKSKKRPTRTAEEQATQSSDAEKIKEDADEISHYTVDIYVERPQIQESLVLRNASVIPMMAALPAVLDKVDIVIQGDRIVYLGKNADLPNDAHVIDMQGKYILPGFIDTHAHFPFYRRVTADTAWALQANLAFGVTTGIDVQSSTLDILEYGVLVDSGALVGTRVLTTGPGVFNDNDFKSKKHARKVLERYKNHYGVRNIKAYLSGNRKQRQWLVHAAQELKLNTTTEGALDLKLDLTHALDGFTGNEHNLPIVGLYHDVASLFGLTRIAYTPTLLVSYGGPFAVDYYFTRESPRSDAKLLRFTPPHVLDAMTLRRSWVHDDVHIFDEHAAQARKILHAGGRVGVGSHGELQGLGYHWEMYALKSGGMTDFEVLQAATRHGAEMLGIADDIGSISRGKLADLLVVNDNPLEDVRRLRNLDYVIKAGVVYDANTLDEIWPDPREMREAYWLNQLPN